MTIEVITSILCVLLAVVGWRVFARRQEKRKAALRGKPPLPGVPCVCPVCTGVL